MIRRSKEPLHEKLIQFTMDEKKAKEDAIIEQKRLEEEQAAKE